MKPQLRLFKWIFHFGFGNYISNDELSKAFLCQSEENLQWYNHTWCCMCNKHWLLSSAKCQPDVVYDLVVDLLFLLFELWPALACPSPLGSAPSSAPSSCPSPPGCAASPSPPELDLELQIISMILAGWLLLCLCAVKEQWCSLCWFPIVSNVSCFSWFSSWCCSSSRQLGFVSYCGAASTTLLVLWLSYLWAVCLHASLRLISSSPGRAVKLLCALLICTPVTEKNICYTWAKYSMMQWQNLCPSLRVLILTLNPFLLFLFTLFCRLQLMKI
jgi:hypothetical protein